MNCRIVDCIVWGYYDGLVGQYAYGGGIYGCDGPIVNCVIEGNRVAGGFGTPLNAGGGLSNCDGPIVNCRITGNSGARYGTGGGLYDCDGDIINCLIADNNLEWYGRYGAGLSGCDANIINCTIAYNLGQSGSGRMNSNLYDCDGLIRNCIIWGQGVDDAGIRSSEAVVEYSNVMGGYEGEGNIDVEPMFADVANGDYHLESAAGRWDPNSGGWVYDGVTSGCIDGGAPGGYWDDVTPHDPHDSNYVNDPSDDIWVVEVDWCGEYWPHGGRINMGAYGGTGEASMSLSSVGSAGDLDCDGAVWFYDFGLFAGQWGLQNSEARSQKSEGPPWRGDLDRDGLVGLADLAVLVEEWVGL